MDFKQLFDDDRAVSPVIGVILMVAITVILAAVIGTFVLGLGDQVQSTTPQASFGFETSDSKYKVTITHETGDTIDGDALSIRATQNFNTSEDGSTYDDSSTWSDAEAEDEVSAGSTAVIGADTEDFAGETIRVVYDNPNADSSSTIGKFEVPDN